MTKHIDPIDPKQDRADGSAIAGTFGRKTMGSTWSRKTMGSKWTRKTMNHSWR